MNTHYSKIEVRGHSLKKKRFYQKLTRPALYLLLSLIFSVKVVPLFFKSTKHPLWLTASTWEIQPPSKETMDPHEWIKLPFFYAMGNWPKVFNNEPVFHTIRYEKGPPFYFASQITAHWSYPEIQLVLDGPRTPQKIGAREALKRCLKSGTFSFLPPCISIRRSALARHVHEMEGITPDQWTLKWFEVQDPSIPPEDQAQGIYLRASNSQLSQERFILINPEGRHQALILKRPRTPDGDQASVLLGQIVGNLKTYRELHTARNFINEEIEKVDFHRKTEHSLEEILRVQSLLISRVSVYPQGLDSYYHLSGTTFLLIKHLKQDHSPFAALAMENLENTFRYAHDISENDPKTKQIQALWQEGRQ